MNNLLYIGVFCLCIIIAAAFFALNRKRRRNKSTLLHTDIPISNDDITQAAYDLSGDKNYSNKEKRVSFKNDVIGCVNKFTQFYRKFNMDHEESIIMAKTLLDNKFFVERLANSINSMKSQKYTLPVTLENKCILSEFSKGLINASGYDISLEKIISFANSYQKSRHFRYKEICMLLPIIKLELSKELINHMEYALITSKKYDDCEKMITSLEQGYEYSPEIARKVKRFVNSNAKEALSKLYVDVLNSTLVKDEIVAEILNFCKENRINIDEIVEGQQRILAQRAVIVNKIIMSLWEIEKISFDEMFVQISSVENMLIDDYTDEYKQMTQRTKEHYRSIISKIADHCKVSEMDVAAAAKDITDTEKCHIGHALLGAHRGNLFSMLNKKRVPEIYARAGLYKFLSFVLTLFIIGIYTTGVYMVLKRYDTALILGVLFLVPAYLKATYIAKFIYSKTYKNHVIPMMDFEDSIPDEAKTLVVVPVLGISVEHLKKVLDNLYMVARNNGMDNIVYSMLVDFPSSMTADDEENIVDEIGKEIDKLNENEGIDYIYAMFRKKQLDKVTQTYMGKERKRGAILMLNDFLTEGYSLNFYAANLPDKFKNVQYVITLDEDTMLLPMEAANMIGSIHHPLNRPIVRQGRLVSGVTLMQPKMRTRIKDSARTKFTELYSGDEGYSRYSSASNGVLMNTFGVGLFYGKGIYQPRAFNQILSDKFKDNRILSHDIVEGGYAGCRECEATAIEGFPKNIFSYYKRQERWTRGDWQLIPFVFPFVRNKHNKIIKNDINKVTKTQIIINALQSLNAAILLVSLGLAGYFGCLQVFALVVFAPYVLIWLFEIFKDLAVYHRITKDTKNTIQKKCFDFLILPYRVSVEFFAVIRALWRMLFARHNLLQWSTAAQSNKSGEGIFDYAKGMLANIIVSLVFVFLAGLDYDYAVYNLIVAFAFFAAVFVSYVINKEEVHYEKPVDKDDEMFLNSLLKKTYRYFQDFVDEDTGLVCDNYQKYDNVGCAGRTSPTNIGMSFTANIIALEEKYMDRDAFIKKNEKIITTIEKMEKYRGHLYNWYDTKTAKPIGNRYISSVDSGNLKMSLRVLCKYLEDNEIGEKILKRAKKIADDMDFTFLYDSINKLFYIGFNTDDENHCDSRYDMYMSEARQLSLLEVAENNVSIKHWNSLSREIVNSNPPAMKSWGGSTFEYMMPYIFIGMEKNTLEYTSLENYVYMQQKYCHRKGLPFGISESSYYDFDTSLNYQYKSFGIPTAGNKRGIEGEYVCSPYSAGLILDIAPHIAMNALREYDGMGLAGAYGLYEAVDFTKRRLKKEQPFEMIKSYMAHHQGMMMCGIYNYLKDGFFRKLFMSIDNIRACSEMLNEPMVKPEGKKHKPIEFAKKAYRPPSLADTIGIYSMKQRRQIYCHNMSNGKYHLNTNSKGLGYSIFNNHLINSIADKDKDLGGIYAVLKEDEKVYEFIHSDSERKPMEESFVININSVVHNSIYENLRLSGMAYVSQYTNTEIRKYTIENNLDTRRNVKLYIYSDIALCKKDRYLDHRAFQNLFVSSKVDEENHMLTFSRRKREEEDESIAMSWKVVAEDDYFFEEYGNDAETAMGRYRKVYNALMLNNPLSISSTTIYPAAVASIEISLPPKSTKNIYLLQSCGETVDECIEATKMLMNTNRIDNDYNLSYAKIKASYKFANLSNKHIVLMSKMLPMILYSKDLQKADSSAIEGNTKGTEGLWKFGISGDRPIVLVEIENYEQVIKAEHMLNVHKFFYYSGVKFDLVLLNRDITGYDNAIQQQLFALRNAYVLDDDELKDHIKILNVDSVDYTDAMLLRAVSKCVFSCSTPFTTQTVNLFYEEKLSKTSRLNDSSAQENLAMYNSYGGFDTDNYEYVMKPKGDVPTPMPWCNVLTNSRIGAIVSEKGVSYMWYKNSREIPLLPWRNDAIKDECGIKLNIDDLTYNQSLLTVGSVSHDCGQWKVRHGMGYSIIQKENDNIKVSVSMFVSLDVDCFVQIINITNNKHEDVQIALEYESDIRVGTKDSYFVLNKDIGSGILSKNYFSENLKDKIYYQMIIDDEKNELDNLDGMYDKKTKSALQRKYQLFAQTGITFAILSGVAKDEVHANRLYQSLDVDMVIDMFDSTVTSWKRRICPVRVTTPDEKLNTMTNGFLLYQAQASRIFGRCGYYQCGGAFGFRDQLQDSLAMLYVDPTFTRDMLVEFASHQFEDGDVQHWWHKPARGVRTKIKDDMLFMPYVLCKYINHTKDMDILNEQVNYLENVEISEGKDDWYGDAKLSDAKGSMQEHCMKAINRAMDLGEHGLPLMHGGDWNDGMNKVGIEGSGESVWLGFFLYDVLVEFSQIMMDKNAYVLAEELQQNAIKLKKALNDAAWDGNWYKRAFYDDGAPLGSKNSDECQIDCLSQSWAVISDAADADRGNMSMDAVMDILYDKENKIIKLLWPPFENTGHNPGYIKGYIKGVRENGGQYTHAAIWGIRAMAYLGRGREAYDLLDTINPISHSADKESAEKYKAEPYVVCADVYSAPGQEGRGGWSWYTGSGAWLYNVIVQDVLGIKIINDKLRIYPCINPNWDKYTVELEYEGTSYTINIKNPHNKECGIKSLMMDGKELKSNTVELFHDKKHHKIYGNM